MKRLFSFLFLSFIAFLLGVGYCYIYGLNEIFTLMSRNLMGLAFVASLITIRKFGVTSAIAMFSSLLVIFLSFGFYDLLLKYILWAFYGVYMLSFTAWAWRNVNTIQLKKNQEDETLLDDWETF